MPKIGIFYGSTTGNTENVAKIINDKLSAETIKSISSIDISELLNYDVLLLGSSTWGDGELQDEWLDAGSKLSSLNFVGKKIAFFGTGDQYGYPDTFVDALGLLYSELEKTGATFIGFCSKDGYEYSKSKAEINGKLIGLAIDEDNQSNLTDQRINTWIEKIRSEI